MSRLRTLPRVSTATVDGIFPRRRSAPPPPIRPSLLAGHRRPEGLYYPDRSPLCISLVDGFSPSMARLRTLPCIHSDGGPNLPSPPFRPAAAHTTIVVSGTPTA